MTGTAAVRGLSSQRAAAIRATVGRNEVAAQVPPRIARRVARQFADPLVALLLAAATVTTLLRDVTDTAVILLVIIVNTTIGVTQEVRADRAIAALNQLAAPTARVVRDGREQVLPSADLVPGDWVILSAGDVVPADLDLAEAWRLRLDEAALTGESVPVTRMAGDGASAGTVVVTGRGAGTVTRTGPASALGRIATMVAGARPGPTPLQRRLAALSRTLGLAVVAGSALVLVLGLIDGQPLLRMAITAVSLVVAAVPESLPAVVTLALALGARRMAQRQAIARRLHAVETLGSVTVVAADKTGTLTEGRMAVDRVILPDGTPYRVTGHGYEPTGAVHGPDATDERTGVVRGPDAAPELAALARACVWCNDATLVAPEGPDGAWTVAGDPLEGALLAFAARCGLDIAAERAAVTRTGEQPFDAETRRMVTWQAGADGRSLVACKGAPEAVLTPRLLRPGTDLAAATRMARELTAAGLRVIAVAGGADLPYGDQPAPGRPDRDGNDAPGGGPDPGDAEDAGETEDDPSADPGAGGAVHHLRFLGLVGIGDPIRAGAAEVAATFRTAGIRLIMVTGDHPRTATRIAERLGIWHEGDDVVRGDVAPAGDQARNATVYARIKPDQKLDIVAALDAEGEIVAMTGDGVNDAPALRRADIGVAMGAGGTEVARQAADLILADDNLGTVVKAVAEGRRIYANIRRFLRYGLSGGVAELAVMLVGPFIGFPLPLLPAQILWVNLLTHGLPGVALGAEPADPDTMRKPPRSPDESVLGAGLARAVLATGALISVTVLGAALVAHRSGAPWQTVVFVTLGLAQLGVALAVRAPRRPDTGGNPSLGVAVAISAFLQIIAVYWGPLRDLLGTDPLSAAQLVSCAVVACVPGAVTAAVLAAGRRRSRARP